MSGDSQEQDNGVCPVCGSEYDHKRTETNHLQSSIRRDVVECRQDSDFEDGQTVYVHYDTRFPNAATQVRRKQRHKSDSLINRLLGGRDA